MEKFKNLHGIAAPMPLVNIDTDMIIPKIFLKTIKRSGLGVNLFDEMRYDREGNEIADFGIKCVISTSFADIFHNNCFKNGILPIKLDQEQVDLLMGDAEKGENARMSVDLVAQEITTSDGQVIKFDVDAFKKHCLLEGLDDIGLTMEKKDSIAAFEATAEQTRPWV